MTATLERRDSVSVMGTFQLLGLLVQKTVYTSVGLVV